MRCGVNRKVFLTLPLVICTLPVIYYWENNTGLVCTRAVMETWTGHSLHLPGIIRFASNPIRNPVSKLT